MFSLSWPLLLQLLFTYAIGLVDIYILSLISDTASAAVGAVNTVMAFVIMMFSFMGQGGSLVYAQCLGAGNHAKARRYYTAALVLHLTVGVATSAVLFAFAPHLAAALGLTGAHLEYGSTYLRIVGGTVLSYAMIALFTGILSANGHTRKTMSVAILTNVVNVALLYVLVLSPVGPRWGITGVAVSTAIASFAGLLFSLRLVFVGLRIRLAWLRSVADLIADGRDVLRYAVPTTIEPLLWQAAQIVTTIIITSIGTEALAARMYTLSITNMIGMFSLALAQGVQIAIGHMAGSREPGRVLRAYRTTMWAGLAIAVVLSLITAVSSDWIMHRFTANPQIIADGRTLLELAVIYLPGSSLIMTTSSALRAIGHVRYPAYVGILVLWGIFLPLAYFLSGPVGLGIVGVMLAMGVDENLRGGLVCLRWRHLAAAKRRHLLLDRALPQEPTALTDHHGTLEGAR